MELETKRLIRGDQSTSGYKRDNLTKASRSKTIHDLNEGTVCMNEDTCARYPVIKGWWTHKDSLHFIYEIENSNIETFGLHFIRHNTNFNANKYFFLRTFCLMKITMKRWRDKEGEGSTGLWVWPTREARQKHYFSLHNLMIKTCKFQFLRFLA